MGETLDELYALKRCPECGAKVEICYGLMGGGIGTYALCEGDGCEFFRKVQDERTGDPAKPEEP